MAFRPTPPFGSAKLVPKIDLSDAGLRSFEAPQTGTVDYWDTKLPGFGCRVSQGGAKTFILKLHNSRKALGRYPLISLSEARTEAKRLLAEKTLGKAASTFHKLPGGRRGVLGGKGDPPAANHRRRPQTPPWPSRLQGPARRHQSGRSRAENEESRSARNSITAFRAPRRFSRGRKRSATSPTTRPAASPRIPSSPAPASLPTTSLEPCGRRPKKPRDTSASSFGCSSSRACGAANARPSELHGYKTRRSRFRKRQRRTAGSTCSPSRRWPLRSSPAHCRKMARPDCSRLAENPRRHSTAGRKARSRSTSARTSRRGRCTTCAGRSPPTSPRWASPSTSPSDSSTTSPAPFPASAAIYNRHAYMDEMRAAIDAWEKRLSVILAQRKTDNADASPPPP